MTSGADPGLEWGAGISNYAKHLDLKYLEVNAHLPPLGPHPTYGEFDPNLPPALLVRQVYPKIYDYTKNTFLEEDFEEGRGLVVLGQPGIGKLPTASARATVDHPMDEAGKTAFLFYALVRALKDRIPVVWCRSADMSHWLQFDDEGNVARYTPSLSLRRLSFFDEIPPHDTSFMDPGFIVQVTNPQRRRYKGWAKQFDARFWVMENWSAEEVGAETRYREIDTSDESDTEWKNAYTPQEVFAVIGPSARRCFDPRPKVTGDAIIDFGLEHTIEKLFGTVADYQLVVQLLAGHPTNDTYPPGFRETFFIRHVKVENPLAYNDHLSYEIGTSAQQKLVREKIMKKYTQVEFTAASLRMSSPSVAGYAYEVFAQRTFSHGTEPIAISWFNSTSQLVTRPTASSSFDSEGYSTVEANTLYYPTTPDFPSLNYFFVTDCGQAVMLHVTVRTMHTNEDNGIKKVLGYIQSNTSSPPHTFSFVYIVPFPSSGQKLVSQFEGGERIVSGQTLRVGYTTLQFGNKADGLLKKMIEEESGDTNTDNWRDGV